MSLSQKQQIASFIFCFQIDGIGVHAYVTDAQDVIDYANTLHDTYGLPVWMTEFADQVTAHFLYNLVWELSCSKELQWPRWPGNHG